MEQLRDLLIEEMGDLLHAENQLIKALPKMAKAAHSPDLRTAFEDHLEQTRGHVKRLEQAFEILNVKPKAKTCKAMQGLVDEGQQEIHEGKDMDDALADLALIVAAQKIEHYEMSGYGSLRAMAERIGEPRLARLLADNQSEEEKADQLLTRCSQSLFEQAA